MTSIPEGGMDEIQQRIDRFPTSAKFTQYQRVFCQRFSEIAPEAWAALLVLQDDGIEFFKQDQTTKKEEAARRLSARINDWITRFDLTCWWIEGVAERTLLACVLAEPQGTERPTSLVQALEPDEQGSEEEGWWVNWHPVEVEPFASFTFHPPDEPIVWDSLEETGPQFRKRMVNQYTKWLRGEIARARQRMHLKPAEPNILRVEWFILQRVCRRSINAIATQYGVTRNAVDQGVEAVRIALEMSDHEARPERYRRATQTDHP